MEIRGEGQISLDLNEDLGVIELTLFDEEEFMIGLVSLPLARELSKAFIVMVERLEELEWENKKSKGWLTLEDENTGLLH